MTDSLIWEAAYAVVFVIFAFFFIRSMFGD